MKNYYSSPKNASNQTNNSIPFRNIIWFLMFFLIFSNLNIHSADNSNSNNVNSHLLKTGSQNLIDLSSLKGKDLIMIDDPEPGEIVIPTLYTYDVSNISGLSASSGGNSITDGNGNISEKGIVWSTNPNPTIDNNEGKTSNGTGTNDFSANLTNLNLNTYYYVRAYATNEAGTGYGNEVTFMTLSYYPPPSRQSSNITIYDLRSTNMRISWTNGNGSGTMVVVKTGNDFDNNDIPQSGGYYDDYNNDFSIAPEVVSGSGGGRIVYYGSGNSITMTGLTALTRYRIRLFAYRGNPAGSSAGFNQNTSTNNPIVQRSARFKEIFDDDDLIKGDDNIVNVYPIPAKDYVNIQIKKIEGYNPNIKIFDLNGKEFQVIPRTLNINDESKLFQLDLENFAPGVYNIIIQYSDEILIEKVIINK
ncbi:MAG: T9SS type A sorting domain-containing protein [Candidatus Kapabacteria bacterium]|nr:T9SS type A sorting domain-containing protein [Candidatus Kapabacteria bacterium]